MRKIYSALILVLFASLIQACSGNGFELRKNVELAPQYSKVYLQGISVNNEFTTIFTDALIEAGGNVVAEKKDANSILNFSKFEQDRRIIAFTSDRQAREYLVILNIGYNVLAKDQKNTATDSALSPSIRRINIDRSYLFDPNFSIGEDEEEERVIHTLYEEATRLILLRLKYAKKA